MARFGHHHRNHSFPPSFRYVQKASKTLSTPLPDLDDEPWIHFLEDEGYADYHHFDAGILVDSEVSKRKANKFRPASSNNSTRIVHQHHGSFIREESKHGYSKSRDSQYTRNVDPMIASDANNDSRQPSQQRRSRSTLSGHRHSWQEPSNNLFTVTEEIPQIIISDYDELFPVQCTRSTVEPNGSRPTVISDDDEDVEPFKLPPPSVDSPRFDALEPVEKPDTQFNQMWLGERARL
jgi:hypothetical protein